MDQTYATSQGMGALPPMFYAVYGLIIILLIANLGCLPFPKICGCLPFKQKNRLSSIFKKI